MEINVNLITVENGIPTVIQFDGKPYTLKLIETTTTPTTNNTVRRPYRRYKHKPANADGFDKVYKKWIYKNDILKVKQAIFKVGYDYVPHTDAIVNETRLPLNKTRAILHYMKAKQMVTSKRNKELKVVWSWVDGN